MPSFSSRSLTTGGGSMLSPARSTTILFAQSTNNRSLGRLAGDGVDRVGLDRGDVVGPDARQVGGTDPLSRFRTELIDGPAEARTEDDRPPILRRAQRLLSGLGDH